MVVSRYFVYRNVKFFQHFGQRHCFLLTPVTIQLAKVLDLQPAPILIAEVLFSYRWCCNQIGDTNIMIGSGLSPDAIESTEGGKYAELASREQTSTILSLKWHRYSNDCRSCIHVIEMDV